MTNTLQMKLKHRKQYFPFVRRTIIVNISCFYFKDRHTHKVKSQLQNPFQKFTLQYWTLIHTFSHFHSWQLSAHILRFDCQSVFCFSFLSITCFFIRSRYPSWYFLIPVSSTLDRSSNISGNIGRKTLSLRKYVHIQGSITYS